MPWFASMAKVCDTPATTPIEPLGLMIPPTPVLAVRVYSAPAVPEELLPRLFERLFRVESSRSRDRGGAGLGLALCRTIVEAHAGTITAKPSPLGGLWIAIVFSWAT